MKQSNDNILQTSLYNFEMAADRLKLDKAMRRRVSRPNEKIEMNVSPVLPDGRMVNVNIFVVRHNDAIGPSKGGIRMTPDVTLDDITGLAMEMTWKTSLIGVPFGGGKSGIRFDPAKLSPDDKEVIIRAFIRGARRHIGPEIYIPAPDMGTNEADMGHIRDCISYSEGISITKGCFVTGKPVILGGIVGRRQATGKGLIYTVQEMCEKLGLGLSNMRVVIQGFGNVGSVAAQQISEDGAKVIAVADLSCGLMNADGIDINALLEHAARTGSIKGFENANEFDSEKIFEVECDILIPAAAGSQITAKNADKIKTKFIAEGANAPTTPEADEVLHKKGIAVIPDILCNAGGVFVSYLEYTQETQREQMTLKQVGNRLADRMKQRFDKVYNLAREKGQTLRDTAMDIAVEKVIKAVEARGLLP